MLLKTDVIKEGTFTISKDGNYYDFNSEYTICFEGNRVILYDHCEVNGIGEPIKDLTSLKDLINTIDVLNIT